MNYRFLMAFVLFFVCVLSVSALEDDFDGTSQLNWSEFDGGLSSSFNFVNDRYELHTEGIDTLIAGYVDVVMYNVSTNVRMQKINDSDNFVAYLLGRVNIGTLSGYVCGASSDGAHLWIGKLTNGVYSTLSCANPPVSYNSSDFELSFTLFGDQLFCKVWDVESSEPVEWQVNFTDGNYSSGVNGVALGTYSLLGWNVTQVAFDDVSIRVYPCVESWVGSFGLCRNGVHTWSYVDEAECGTTDDLPVDDGTVSSCTEVISGGGVIVKNEPVVPKVVPQSALGETSGGDVSGLSVLWNKFVNFIIFWK